MKLSEDLKAMRAERPSEWKMDEYIHRAESLESQNKTLVEALEETQKVLQDNLSKRQYKDEVSMLRVYKANKLALPSAKGKEEKEKVCKYEGDYNIQGKCAVCKRPIKED